MGASPHTPTQYSKTSLKMENIMLLYLVNRRNARFSHSRAPDQGCLYSLSLLGVQIWNGTAVTVQNRNDVNRPNIECIVVRRSQWTKFGVMTNLVACSLPRFFDPIHRRVNGWHELTMVVRKKVATWENWLTLWVKCPSTITRVICPINMRLDCIHTLACR